MQRSKYILPVVAGAMAAMMLILLTETAIVKMYLPAGINPEDTAAVTNSVKNLPMHVFLLLLSNYAVCSLIAGIVSTVVAKRTTMVPALVVGTILTLGGLYNVISIQHPLWFTVSNLFVYLPFCFAGYLLTRKKAIE
jgi:surface polysaccharide O-acyltransferase-like enzyme